MQLRTRKTIVLDGRRRALLADIAEYDIYLAEVDEDKRIILTPAEIIPAAQRPKPSGSSRRRATKKAAPAAVEEPRGQE